MRKEPKVSNYHVAAGEYEGHESFTIHFEVVQGGLLRATKEYSLTYVRETDEWFGDVIAYGHWWDLEPGEVDQLREEYDLDAVVKHTSEGLPLY